MSSLPIQEAAYPADQLAQDINRTFMQIALTVPEQVKNGYAGERFTLFSQEGTGVLEAIFRGKPANRKNFMVRVLMRAEGFNGDLGMWKDYALADYHRMPGGMPTETETIIGEDLLECPAPLSKLAELVRVLHSGYMATLEPDTPTIEDTRPLFAA